MKKFFLLLIFNSAFLVLNSFCLAQNTNLDSLNILLKADSPDTNKVNHLNNLSKEYIKIGDYDSGLKYGNKALALASSLSSKFTVGNRKGWVMGIAAAYSNIGLVYYYQGNYSAALKNYFTVLRLREEIGDKSGLAGTYNNIGMIYWNIDNYPEALKNHFAAVKIKEEIGDKKGLALSYNNIGIIYKNQGNNPEAIKNYFAALKIKEEIGDKQGIAISYNNIGGIYENQGNYREALKNHFASLKISEDINDKQGIAMSYNNIGNIYFVQGNYPEALKNHLASLRIKKEIGDKNGIANSYNNIGSIYDSQGNYPEALKNYSAALAIREVIGYKQGIAATFCNIGILKIKLNKLKEAQNYLDQALDLSKEIGSKDNIKNCYSEMAIIDSIQGNWKLAYQHHKLFIVYRDSIDNEETKKKTIQSAMTYEFDKKELATKVEQDKKDAVAAAESKKQKNIRNIFIGGFILMLFFGLIIVRENHQKRMANNQLKEKNRVIAMQKILVEQKNRDISDSVAYAQRIQSSFLTSESYIKRHLPEYFILYNPRDIVSGDFYWVHQQGDYLYFCIADCTGHGIPGAFMSLIGMGILNEIIYSKQIKDTNEILDELRRIVILALNPEGAVIEGKDGIDLILGRLNLQTKEVQYSAANNSFYVYRKEKLIKHKPDKMPVGKYGDFEKPFTRHTIQLETGDIIYASTDGFLDQFGGLKGKKFMAKRFEEYVLSITNKPLADQKEMLEKEFMNWKGNMEQVDDVCVFGLKI